MSEEARESEVKVGSILKVRFPSSSNGKGSEEKEKYVKYVVLKLKRFDTTTKCKLQAIENAEDVIKVSLSKVDWKLVQDKTENNNQNKKKRKHSEDLSQSVDQIVEETQEKQKKKKKDQSSALITSHSSSSLPRSFHFKRGIPDAVLRYICAPMVGASELAFRLLVRKYGATLAYTPMINSERFAHDEEYRKEEFQTNNDDRPLVAHFSANNPELFLKAVKYVENQCDAIDLNLGCPQRVAYQGHFGSFLLDEVDRPLVLNMVRTIAENSIVPIFVKIRLLDTIEDTIRLCQQLVEAGAALIAIHGRYRVNLVNRTGPGARDGPAHLDQIKAIREVIPRHIPIIANGNIKTWQDVQDNLQFTACNGVMSAEGLLDNPAIFNHGITIPAIQLAKEYLQYVESYPVKLKTLIFHIRRICKDELTRFQLMEECLNNITNLQEMIILINKLEDYIKNPSLFHYNSKIEQEMKKRLEEKKNEESKRKLFEERMIRKAKREGKKDLLFYVNQGAEVPSIEEIERLKKMTKDDAFTIWKEKHSQHCWNYHFHEKGCERDRKCAFIHMDPKYMEDNDTHYG